MDIRNIIRSQLHASLDMLEAAIVACPDDYWDRPEDMNRSWHLAYHTLFYTHLYLQPSEAEFEPWHRQEDHYRAMGKLAEWLDLEDASGDPLDRAGMLEYLAFCREQTDTQTASLKLEASESGFPWLPMSKLELQFYNIRHIEHHTAQLIDRIRQHYEKGVAWCGWA